MAFFVVGSLLATGSASAQCPVGLGAGLLADGAEPVSSEALPPEIEQSPVVVASTSIACAPTATDAECEGVARQEFATSAAGHGAGATIMANVIERPAAIIATFDINGTIETLRFDTTEDVFAYIAESSSDPGRSIVVQSITTDGIAERFAEVTAVVWQPHVVVPDGLRVRFRDGTRSMDDVALHIDATTEIWGVELVRFERVAGGAGQYIVDVRCPAAD